MAKTIHFIDKLPLKPNERDRVKSLGTDSPFALLSTIVASRDAMERWLGVEVVEHLTNWLTPQLTSSQQAALRQPPVHFALGARLEPSTSVGVKGMDTGRRERLLKEIDSLSHDPSGERKNREKIEELEREIAALYQ